MTNVPAGWYPDPAGSPLQRWWDGSHWSETTQPAPAANPYAPMQGQGYGATQPYGSVQPYNASGSYYGAQAQHAPEGTNPTTPWAWVIALWPLLGLVSTGVSAALGAYGPSVLGARSSSFGDETLVIYAIAFVGWVGFIAVAFFDYRELVNRMVPSPFHWLFAIIPLPIIYVIGRSVVVYSRTRRGLAPLFVWIGAGAFNLVASIAIGFVLGLQATNYI